VSFTTDCPACGKGKRGSHSVQTNTVRPWECRCECGMVLHREEREMPVLVCVGGKPA
jgi:hypothetical protein